MRDFPDRSPAEGESHVIFGTFAGNNIPDTGREEALIAAIDLENYEASYDAYTLFHTGFFL